ncbi:TFIIF-interacting CTD phosphatase, including NLI-interacting factor [Trachipleistophora hominis]|uniref:protein-serine/threonine phosphatase n=1 Tax=Trachipleistophora hominis TaxID=72359 RepID=L7JXE9_TRAHO|nr:TFIIF-interacting CTD phosphatase, including NLI-interacting factor [Trachipleistophora hominis]
MPILFSSILSTPYPSMFCQHPVKLNKLCALCGQEVQDSDNTKFYNALHSNSRLMVDKETIDSMYVRYRDELIKQRKMILVVDLDQTILHSIEIERSNDGNNRSNGSIDEGYKTTNANSKSSSDGTNNADDNNNITTNTVPTTAGPTTNISSVYNINESSNQRTSTDNSFPSSFTYTLSSTTMHTTLRPHLHQFLTEASKLFHMHIYTMGTAEYVHQITNVIDKDGMFFGDRIVTRDDEMQVKRLERLFGDKVDMVVIVDDRGDVWEYCGNLVMVRPFLGIDGDRAVDDSSRNGTENGAVDIIFDAGTDGVNINAVNINSINTDPSNITSPKVDPSNPPNITPHKNDNELLILLHTLQSIHHKFYATPNQSAKAIITSLNTQIFKNKTFAMDHSMPDIHNIASIIRMHGGTFGNDGCDIVVGDDAVVRWVMECVWRRRWIDCGGLVRKIGGWWDEVDEWVDELEKGL